MPEPQQNGDAKVARPEVTIDAQAFSRRIKLLYKCWEVQGSELWRNAEAVAIAAGPASEDLRYLKSSALQIWLLGYEFPDTVMVFLKNSIQILCSGKKAHHLESLCQKCKQLTGGIDMKLLPKERKDDGSSQMNSLLAAIRDSSTSEPPIVGVLAKEPAEGNVMKKWCDLLTESGMDLVDIAAGMADVFAVKEDVEITNVKKAAHLCSSALKLFVVPELEEVIDEERDISHAQLSERTEERITDPQKINVKLRKENVDIAYPPVFQSGGVYDLKPGVASNNDNLSYDTAGIILVALGTRYSSYCANVARSYLIDATPEQTKAYKALHRASEAAIAALVPGKPLASVYEAAVAAISKEDEQLVPFFSRNCGAGIGLEFRESSLVLNAKNTKEIRAGMVFNLVLGFSKLPGADDSPASALQLGDTIIVRARQPAEVLTAPCSKDFKDVAYSLKDASEGEEEGDGEGERELRQQRRGDPVHEETAALRGANKEAERKLRQEQLAMEKLEETRKRLMEMDGASPTGAAAPRVGGDFVAYRNLDEVPTSRELMIQVDQRNEAVLLPIYGLMVPFHVSTIKSVSNQQDSGISYIRINFNVPGTAFNAGYVPAQKNPDSIFLREVSYRSPDVRHSNQVVQLLKTLRRQVAQKESEKADRATLKTQEKLQLGKGRVHRLPDLWIRPAFGGRGRKISGTLEAHVNGFHYSTGKADERVDVMYRNIKHAVFQPASNEMITLIHFHLHDPIMVGKKKTQDVQFYSEVMEQTQALNGSRRSMYDPDEIEEEQRERDRRNRINKDFDGFVKRVQEMWERDFGALEFDIPFKELGFHGVPFKSSSFVVPTVNCLVELIDMPFLVVTLDEVEIVSLERVGTGKKSFDMVIIFKEFSRDVQRIDSIPTSSLEGIKDWLNQVSIKYYENRLPLVWKQILKTILADPEKFVEDGGWEAFLNAEASDDESGSSEESEGYVPSGSEPEESEESESEEESVVESDEDEVEEEEEEEEEEGLSWDELEAQARRDDHERGESSDSEDERRRRKAKQRGREEVRGPPPKKARR